MSAFLRAWRRSASDGRVLRFVERGYLLHFIVLLDSVGFRPSPPPWGPAGAGADPPSCGTPQARCTPAHGAGVRISNGEQCREDGQPLPRAASTRPNCELCV
ncbi:unnamed protein product [Lampetra fluviatilis]